MQHYVQSLTLGFCVLFWGWGEWEGCIKCFHHRPQQLLGIFSEIWSLAHCWIILIAKALPNNWWSSSTGTSSSSASQFHCVHSVHHWSHSLGATMSVIGVRIDLFPKHRLESNYKIHIINISAGWYIDSVLIWINWIELLYNFPLAEEKQTHNRKLPISFLTPRMMLSWWWDALSKDIIWSPLLGSANTATAVDNINIRILCYYHNITIHNVI